MEDNKIQEQNPKKKKTDIKKTLRNFLALVLVAVISVVATLAYLSTLSEREENTFTGSRGIKVDLTETNFGKNDGENYTPGKEIPKNPILTNKSSEDKSATEWVAMLVTYKYVDDNAPATYSQIQNVIEDIAIVTKGAVAVSTPAAVDTKDYWQKINISRNGKDSSKYAIYMYCRTLAYEASTNPLFEQIKIKNETALKTVNGFYNAQNKTWSLPNFKIVVQGAAIKNEYFKENDSTAPAEKWTDLSTDDQNQLQKDLEEVFYDNNLLPN